METYEEIVQNMMNNFKLRAGYSADEASDVGIRIRVLAGEIYNLKAYFEWIKRQAFPQTAQGEYLDYHAQMRGLERKTAQKAVGSLLFSLPEVSTVKVEIPAGTIVSTSGEEPISFQTTEYAYIDIGQKTVTVSAEAVEGGVKGNVIGKLVSVIVTMTADNLTVTNLTAFTQGADAEDDETLRSRIINSLKFIINGTNNEYYSMLAKTVSGVECVNVVPRRGGTGTVWLYISGKSSTLDSETVAKVQSLLSEQREVNVAVTVRSATLLNCTIDVKVTLEDGYSLENVQSEAKARLEEILSTYNVGQSLEEKVINDVLYHTEGIKSFEIATLGTSGLTASVNQKIVLQELNLREA